MIINHNMNALNAHRMMSGNTNAAGKSMEKLSSGLRINRAGDDAAGLAISEKMRAQVRGLDQAARNGQDGISMIQTAEGALNETHSILQRMRELAVQSSNDTNVAVDRGEIQKEMDELAKEITRIANNTEFNTQKLINGGIKSDGMGEAKFHIGANANQDISLSINAMDAKSLGVSRDINVAEQNAVAGDVASVTFDSEVGTGVEDGATVTLSYTAAVASTPATAGKAVGNATYANIGALNTALGDCSGVSKTLVLTIDGVDKTITFDQNYSAGGAYADWAAFKTDVDAKLGGAATVVGADAAGFTFTSGTTGAASKVVVKTDASTLMGAAPVSTDGVAAVAAQSAKVTLTSNGAGAKTQSVNVTGDETSLKIADGFFKGTTISLGAAASAIAGGNDTFTIDVTTDAASKATFSGGAKTADAVTEAGIDVSTQTAASTAITTIQTAIETVSTERSKLGAYQNRLEHTIANLGTASENLTSAESRIRDVDMAKEMMQFSKNNILSQAAQAMLAQANQQPQGVLQLLR